MAERRMFAKTIIDSDAFLDMPVATQCLYFHLGMRADDDGVIANPKSIMRICGAREDDMNLLIAKKFILVINNQIIVIKHWKINNYIQKDRYKQSNYYELISQLSLDENNAYTMRENNDVYIMDTQVSIGKDSIDNICITNINITNTSELVSLTPNENALISLILNNKKYFNIFQKDI
ncbi:MAG: replisome organizer, partial [Acholeplasmatales bacterium]|nr:replisome organizer [Acholeplasmatales bacterium]